MVEKVTDANGNQSTLGGSKENNDFLKFFQVFVECSKEKNDKLTLAYKNSKKGSLASKEFLSIVVSECLIDDIKSIQKLREEKFANRYVDAAIRNMCEQVIEYIYIIKNPNLIKKYFGEDLTYEYPKDDSIKTLIKSLTQTGKARFGKRERVMEMAKDIGELDSDDNKLALYDIFKLKSELEHNSYFNHLFELMDEVNSEETEKENQEKDFNYLICILSAFSEVYDKI